MALRIKPADPADIGFMLRLVDPEFYSVEERR